jgi:alpha-D-xyloside xylohydrolase
MPYLYKTSVFAHETGIPVMRSMILEYQDDFACTYLDKQYMLGDSILVAPIFNELGEANYYLPHGKWTNFITGKKCEGGRWVKEIHDYLSIPMLVKENSLIAIGNEDKVPDYDYREGVSILAYELKDGVEASTKVLDMNGKETLSVKILKRNNKITIESEGVDKPFNIIFKNVTYIKNVEGGSLSFEGNDTKIVLSGSCRTVCELR